MFRAIGAVVLTILGLFLVLTFKTTPVQRVVATPGATSAVAAAPPTPDPVATAPPTPNAVRTVDGPVITMRWGSVQVAVVLRGTTITDISALELPMERARSAYISQTVAPMLRSEVLQAQSANINVISGATFTTEAYAQSLQAALDSARA